MQTGTMGTEEKAEEKTTVWDVRFELAALRGLAAMHGVPEDRFDQVMNFAGEILTWTPPKETKPEDVKFTILQHVEDAITEFVVEHSMGELRTAIPELLVLGAAMSSLLRKWHVEAHPDTAKQPHIEVKPITFEEFEELKKKGLETSKVEVPLESPMEDEEEEEKSEYTPTGDEGWIGGGEDRDVV